MRLPRRGVASNAVLAIVGSLAAVGVLTCLMMDMNSQEDLDNPSHQQSSEENGDSYSNELVLYCAAGIRKPIEDSIKQFQQEVGIKIQPDYAGSGALLGKLRTVQRGDLYLAADKSYTDLARKNGLLAEVIPLGKQKPVIAVRKGNPKGITSIDDLLRDDVTYTFANPDQASVGKLTRKILMKTGQWEAINKNKKGTKPTVNEVATDVQLGTVDAAIVWDANVKQRSKELDMVEIPAFDAEVKQIHIGVLKSCKNPAAALKFCRYLQAPLKGGLAFARHGYQTIEGDPWAEKPRLVLYSGGVNRVAIQETVAEFQRREGVDVTVDYNGCGILVTQIKAAQAKPNGTLPDAYFACDVSFMVMVQDVFPKAVDVSSTDIIIAVKKGNPRRIESIHDLKGENLRIGVTNEKKSALGKLTADLLRRMGIYEEIFKNVKAQTATADLVVKQLILGNLDAAIVYRANTTGDREKINVVEFGHKDASATQPIAMCSHTKYPYLTRRLIDALTSAQSSRRFRTANFNWLFDKK